MRILEIENADVMRLAIHDEIRRSDESRYDHRLHAMLLVTHGYSANHVAELLGQSPRTVQNWVRRFNESGFAGLREHERPGRPTRLDDAAMKMLGQDLRKQPDTFGHSQNLWDGKLLQHHLALRYDVKLGVRQCQRLFRELGFRLRKPRPVIAQADPKAQSAYKKTPPLGGQKRS
jgi:transposase